MTLVWEWRTPNLLSLETDKCHFRVVEDRVIVDGLDPIKGDVVENFLDVVFRCRVANVVQFVEKDVATTGGKLEGIGGKKWHLDGAWTAAEKGWNLGGTGREAWNGSGN
jgi:hypothetical protein